MQTYRARNFNMPTHVHGGVLSNTRTLAYFDIYVYALIYAYVHILVHGFNCTNNVMQLNIIHVVSFVTLIKELHVYGNKVCHLNSGNAFLFITHALTHTPKYYIMAVNNVAIDERVGFLWNVFLNCVLPSFFLKYV